MSGVMDASMTTLTPSDDQIEKMILRSMNEGVLTLECNGEIHAVNPAALKILGLRDDELVGRPFQEAISDDPANSAFREVFRLMLEEGRPTPHREVQFRRSDGQTVDLSIAASFLQINECIPNLQNMVAVFRDITAFKVLEKMKRRAVDHLSHELKTPLAIIEASVERLGAEASTTAAASRAMERIRRNIGRLREIQEIVEEILDPREAQPKPIQIAEEIESRLDELRRESSHRYVSISARVDPIETESIDPEILATVLRTLVKNAVENTPDDGEITVLATRVSDGIALRVDDRGQGIPVEDREFIFEGFHHTLETDDYTTKKPFDFNAGGKGLELLRLKVLAEMGLFEISYESERCRYIPRSLDHCPGKISMCPRVEGAEGCRNSGGASFTARFKG
jgi:two-component system phosphate regulon sensor histidine kinase PhoR